jgi:integrase
MAKKPHRRRHPGVTLIKPDEKRRIGWRARFVDPDSGRTTKVSLPLALRTDEARRDWAADKSKDLVRRKLELEAGAPRATGTDLERALKTFFDDHESELRGRTLEIYRGAAARFREWAERVGLRTADDLTLARLTAFRADLGKAQKSTVTKGGKRGEKRATGARRSATTANIDLRSVRTILGYLRKRGLAPRLSTDDLRDGLEKFAVEHERGAFLRPVEIAQLLEAAIEHDGERYKVTREEHAGLRPPGTTPRYGAIAPLIAGALLTGMRRDEVTGLEWREVDVDAFDEHDQPGGEINLPAARVKTKHARMVDLSVCPKLRELLDELRPDGARGGVWGLSENEIKAAMRRLEGKAPEWNWQMLRRTCGTYLTCAPAIYGAAAAYMSAKRLGHSVSVAEKHYAGVLRGISREARTLEAAMGIEAIMERVIESARARRDAPTALAG